MFRFLKRVMFSKPRKRELFGYYDGEKYVWADPIEISDALESDPEFVADKHLLAAEQDDDRGRQAFALCIRAFRRAFNLPEYDSVTRSGLTTSEVNALFVTYCLYTETLKKNINQTQMQQQSTDATSNESGKKTPSDTLDTSSINPGNTSEQSTRLDKESLTESSPNYLEEPQTS